MSERLAFVGGDGLLCAMLARVGTGTAWGAVPQGWAAAASPGEAAARADFTFVSGRNAEDHLFARGIVRSAPAGSCIVLFGVGAETARALAPRLDDEGLDTLDMAVLPGRPISSPPRFAFGGERDTFNLLRPLLREHGRPVYCGAVGAGALAAAGEDELLFLPPAARLDRLQPLFARAEAHGAFPQALRNLWKAGPLAAPDFDARADALTK